MVTDQMELQNTQAHGRILWISAFAALMMFTPAEAADVYRWVDENGRVQYSDQPGQVGQAPIQVKPSAPSSDPDSAQRRQRRERLLRIFAEDRERERAARRERAAQQAERERRCRTARNELADLERGGVFYQLGDDGQRHYLDQQAVAGRKAHWRSEVKKLCGSD